MQPSLRLSLRLLLLLWLVAFTERLLFAAHYPQLTAPLSYGELAQALLAGWRFDLSLAAELTLLAYLVALPLAWLTRRPFTTTLRLSAYPILTAALLLQGADLIYYGEAGRHLGYELREGANSGGALLMDLVTTYGHELAVQLLLLVGALALLHLLLRPPADPPRRFGAELALLPVLILGVILVRGGLQSIPLEPLHAQSLGGPNRAALALNGGYNALHALASGKQAKPLLPLTRPTPEALAQLAPLYRPTIATEVPTPAPRHVVVLLLESWSARYMSAYGYEQETTPRFAQWMSQGLSVEAMLAGGHRTTEGMFATFCSEQNPLGATVAQTQLQEFRYNCLPRLATQAGYRTLFVQGTHENTSGTGDFARLLGFEESWGLDTLPQHRLPLHSWGLHDPDIYDYVLQRLRSADQPLFIGVNTNSTHSSELPPDEVPAFPGDDRLHRYLSTLKFADAAFGHFLDQLAADPQLSDTLVVALADHAGLAPERPVERYLIPFALHAPGLPPRHLNSVASQRDVAPTLAALLGLPRPPSFTGHSLLGGGPSAADYYHSGRLGWVENGVAVEFPLRGAGATECLDPHQAFAPIPCGPNAEAARQRAKVFTQLSQWLLFSGHTEQFDPLINTQLQSANPL